MLDELRRDGVAVSQVPLRATQVADLKEWFDECDVYDGHVRAKSTRVTVMRDAAAHSWPMFCAHMERAVLAPHLLEVMLGYYDVAREYFDGEEPVLYSMNAFWTCHNPHAVPYQDTHGWHRDADDRKQLVVFVYGSDVFDVHHGPHQYQPGTHLVPDEALGRDFRASTSENTRTILGPAGTVFLADTRGLHIGQRPTRGLRSLMWGRWGVSTPPQSYEWDNNSPADRRRLGARYPREPHLQQAIRFVAA